jgi:hypothetical protein
VLDGGDCLGDLGVLRNQPELSGEMASTATAWRVIEQVACDEFGVARLRAARGQARARAWTAGAWVDGLLVINVDGTLLDATPTSKGRPAPTRVATGSTHCWPSWTGAMGPARRWPGSCIKVPHGPPGQEV